MEAESLLRRKCIFSKTGNATEGSALLFLRKKHFCEKACSGQPDQAQIAVANLIQNNCNCNIQNEY